MKFFKKTISYKYSLIIIGVIVLLAFSGGVVMVRNSQDEVSIEEKTEFSDSEEAEDDSDSEEKEDADDSEEKASTDESETSTTKTTKPPAETTPAPSPPPSPPPPSNNTITVNISGSGFTPSTVTISSGDTVKWVNNDSKSHWPATDPHPQHTGYSGFDSKPGISSGSSWSFKFNNKGTWNYHDHLFSSKTGTIIVN